MIEAPSFKAKPVGLTVLLFFVLALILAGVYYVSAATVEKGIRGGAQATLDQWKDKAPKLGDRIGLTNTGWAYIWAFHAEQQGRNDGIAYVLRITGNSGPYTAVFYRTEKQGTRFCGLAGVQYGTTNPDKYGISARIIDMWTTRLDSISADGGSK